MLLVEESIPWFLHTIFIRFRGVWLSCAVISRIVLGHAFRYLVSPICPRIPQIFLLEILPLVVLSLCLICLRFSLSQHHPVFLGQRLQIVGFCGGRICCRLVLAVSVAPVHHLLELLAEHFVLEPQVFKGWVHCG